METMTLPEKLRSAAKRPDGWDVPGLLEDAACSLEIAADAAQAVYRKAPFVVPQLANQPVEPRREVVPGWTLDEILQREG